MTAVRMYLLAVGVCSLVLGLAYVIRPVEMAALTEFTLPSPMAIIEIRAFYGGQLVGLGFAILLGLWDRRFLFTDDRVIASLKDFVPVTGNTHDLQNRRSELGTWFMQTVAKVNSRVENGQTSRIDLEVLEALARELRVEPGFLIVRSEGAL